MKKTTKSTAISKKTGGTGGTSRISASDTTAGKPKEILITTGLKDQRKAGASKPGAAIHNPNGLKKSPVGVNKLDAPRSRQSLTSQNVSPYHNPDGLKDQRAAAARTAAANKLKKK